jgi:tight adherence protein C
MTVLLLLLGLLLVAASVALAARAVALPRLRAAERRVQIASYGFPQAEAGRDAETKDGLTLDRLAERIGAAVLPRLKSGGEDELRGLLASAGMYTTGPGKFLGYRVLSTVVLLGVWIWLGTAAGAPPLLSIVGAAVAGLAGWVLPLTALRRRAQRRCGRIDYEMPQLIDSLIVTVEAGLGFDGALRMAARELRGPLADEVRLTLKEQDMGLTTTSALSELRGRADTPSMRSFVRAVQQAESLGVSIGEILRSLAVEMRARRRAQVEQRAQKAPIKMLFPLTFCIFPAILIVLAYPGVKSILEALGG